MYGQVGSSQLPSPAASPPVRPLPPPLSSASDAPSITHSHREREPSVRHPRVTHLSVEAECLVELSEDSVRHSQSTIRARLQWSVPALFGCGQLLVVVGHGLVELSHLHERVTHVAQRAEGALRVLHHVRDCWRQTTVVRWWRQQAQSGDRHCWGHAHCSLIVCAE